MDRRMPPKTSASQITSKPTVKRLKGCAATLGSLLKSGSWLLALARE